MIAPETVGITSARDGLDGMVWNIMGQVYVPKQVTDTSFAWHATFPIETFVPPHIHTNQEEYIFVVDGALDLLLAGDARKAAAGDLVRMPRGIPHGIFNNSGRIVTALFWVSPTDKLVDLFKALHNVGDNREVVRIAAAHDVVFLPPQKA